jgi:cell division protein FtsB
VRIASYVLAGILVLLQYPLWFGDGGALALWKIKREISAQREENIQLGKRNRALAAEVEDLKQGLDAVEDRARSELGMVGRNEIFYQIVEPPGAGGNAKQAAPDKHERAASGIQVRGNE